MNGIEWIAFRSLSGRISNPRQIHIITLHHSAHLYSWLPSWNYLLRALAVAMTTCSCQEEDCQLSFCLRGNDMSF